MPIHVTARLRAKPGKEGTVEVALRQLIAATRAEPGCVRYDVFRSVEDPCAFAVLEEFKDDAAYEEHKRAPHLASALAQAGPFLAGAPEIRVSPA